MTLLVYSSCLVEILAQISCTHLIHLSICVYNSDVWLFSKRTFFQILESFGIREHLLQSFCIFLGDIEYIDEN